MTADLAPERYLYTREYQLLKLLRERRTAAKVSQAELAVRLHWTQAEVSKCETGVRRLDVTEMKLWLDALGTSLVDFVGKLQDERLPARVQTCNTTSRRSDVFRKISWKKQRPNLTMRILTL